MACRLDYDDDANDVLKEIKPMVIDTIMTVMSCVTECGGDRWRKFVSTS